MKQIIHTALTAMTLIIVAAMPCMAAPKNSIETLKARAQDGDLRAAITLGQRYRDGVGVEKDFKEALKWYRLSADAGSARGMDNVGFMYLRGWGVKKNERLAAAYFEESAKGRHAQGYFNLGNCHFSGLGVEQNYTNAIMAWQEAADLGHDGAAWRLAVLHAAGEGTPQDTAKAKELCSRLEETGQVKGLLLLGEILFNEGKTDSARRLWRRAAKKDSEIAQALLEIADLRTKKTVPGASAYVEVGHLYQGWNNCGATSIAMFARSLGCETDPYAVKRLCPRSPIGTGTDWADLVQAGKQLKQDWRLVTFSYDGEGFTEGAAVIRQHLDAGCAVVIDFTYTREELGVIRRSGHTLLVVGYHADKDQYILKNPNQPPPGIQLMSSDELADNWYSRGYSRLAEGVTARPLILLADPPATVPHKTEER